MNKTIYLNTIRKILKHKFVITILIVTTFCVPFATLGPNEDYLKLASIKDSFLTVFVVGMLIITLTNPFPVTISMSGRMDYMPLIITRPIPRWHYVCSKWLALSTILCGMTITQQVLFTIINIVQVKDLTTMTVLCSFLDRVLIGMSMSSILTFVYLMPTEMTILIGILAIQIAAATHLLPTGLVFPQSESSDTATDMTLRIFGFNQWLQEKIYPIIFGSSSRESLSNYTELFKHCTQFLAPNIYTYDLFKARPLYLTPLLQVLSNTALALVFATITLNVREFHYDSD